MVGAKVRLIRTSTAESTTAADGSFSLAALPAGKYKLTIVADGTTATYAQTIASSGRRSRRERQSVAASEIISTIPNSKLAARTRTHAT